MRLIAPKLRSALVVAFVAALSQSCNPASLVTWRGKTIEVRGANGVSIDADRSDRAEVEVADHRIVVTDTTVTLNGTTKAVAPFTRILIENKGGALSVTVNGKPLVFP